MLYFGYGSNLDLEDLRAWARERGLDASGIRPLGAAHLPDHRLAFHYRSAARGGGALDVVPSRFDAVPGALFEVDDAGAAALDAKEGAPRFYERATVRVLDLVGEEREATSYVVTAERREDRHVAPTEAYVCVVERGLDAFGLSAEPLRRAARALDAAPWPGRVFAYGTLRTGDSRAGLLSGERAPARVLGRLVDLGAYPGLLLGASAAEVVGERVAATPSELERLDDVEDFSGYGEPGSLYRRVIVRLADGAWAWTYLWLGAPGSLIPGGDWLRRKLGDGVGT